MQALWNCLVHASLLHLMRLCLGHGIPVEEEHSVQFLGKVLSKQMQVRGFAIVAGVLVL